MFGVLIYLHLATAATATAATTTSNILLTGYWSPTNNMLEQFHAFPLPRNVSIIPPAKLNWAGRNWENRGYNIYAFFPTFDSPNDPVGTGDFRVDYQYTSEDWVIATELLNPVAIITFSRGDPGSSWVVESRTKNRRSWIGDYITPTQPTPAPPDSSVPAETVRYSSLPMQAIVDAVNTQLGLKSWINTGDNFAGGFLSEFVGYHGMWYHDIHSTNLAGGHIHVGIDTPVEVAIKATEISLRELIITLIEGLDSMP